MNRKKIYVVNMLLFIDFMILAISGFLLHGVDTGKFLWAITHSVTGILCIVLVFLHIVQHRKMIKTLKRQAKSQE